MINWREIPFVRVLAFYLTGILTSFYFNFYHSILWIVLWLLAACLFWLKFPRRSFGQRWLFGSAAMVFLFLSGYLSAHFYNEQNVENHFTNELKMNQGILFGVIGNKPIIKGDWVRLKMNVQGVRADNDQIKNSSGNILLYVARDTTAEAIRYGDLIYVDGRFVEIQSPENPCSFNYRQFLHFQNIHYQAFIRAGNWGVQKNSNRFSIVSASIEWQQFFLEVLKKYIPGEKELAVGAALLLGHRDDMPETIKVAYAQTGAMHVLAVSGLHVGIVFLIVNFFLKRIKHPSLVWRISKIIILLLVIWGFALVTGAAPSVTRAAVMFSFLNVGLAFRRYSSIYNTLAASAFFMLLYDPYLIAHVGFQLSYLAVVGIVFFQPKLAACWMIKNKFGRYLWELVCVSFAAQIMTMPLSFYYFNQFPFYFWLTGILLVPLAGVELGVGILVFILEGISPMLAAVLGSVLNMLFCLGNGFVFYVQQLPAAVIDGIWIDGLVGILCYFLILSFMVAISSRRYKWINYSFIFLCLICLKISIHKSAIVTQRQVVLYHINQQSLIDFFNAEMRYTISGETLTDRSAEFAATGQRLLSGWLTHRDLIFEDKEIYQADHLFKQDRLIQYYDVKIAVVDEPADVTFQQRIKVDYVLFRKSPEVTIKEVAGAFEFKALIFDGSNKKWQVKKWKQACKVMGVSQYDTAEKGALVINLNQ